MKVYVLSECSCDDSIVIGVFLTYDSARRLPNGTHRIMEIGHNGTTWSSKDGAYYLEVFEVQP